MAVVRAFVALQDRRQVFERNGVTWSMCVILENTGKTQSKGGFSLSTNEKRALNHKALKEKMPSCEVIRGIEKIYL